MKGLICIVGSIIYSSCLFLINSFWVLGILLAIELIALVFLGNDRHKNLKFLLKNCGFVLFVMLCNLCFTGLTQSLLVGARLWLVVGTTYLTSRLLTTREFAQGIARICSPLKIFGVDTEEITLSIMVALTFIPVLAEEAKSLQRNLKLKGCTGKNFWRQPWVYATGMIDQLFDHVKAAEQTLRLRGYE